MYMGAGLGAPTWLARHADRLAWPLGLLFLLGHAALGWTLTGAATPAVLAAVSVLTVRQSLGGEYWGFDGASSVGVRTLTAIAAPWLLLTAWGWLVLLVHPTTLWRALSRPDDTGEARLTREAITYRFGYLFAPEPRELASVAAHMALPFAVWCWAGTPLLLPVGVFLLVALLGPGLVRHFGCWQEIQTLRALRYLYPVFGLGFAHLYATASLGVGVTVFLASLIPPSWVLGFVRDCLGIGEPAPHCPGRDDVHGTWFKAGALAYLRGTRPLVEWYRAKPA